MLGENIIITVIIGVGLVGNFISICLFIRKSFSKTNIRNILIIKLVVNSVTLAFLLPGIYKSNSTQFLRTTWYCKILQAVMNVLPAYNSWLLVFISLERLVSIRFSVGRLRMLFTNQLFQLGCSLVIFLICLFYYTANWVTTEIRFYKFVNYTFRISSEPTNFAVCFVSADIALINYFMDMPFSVLIPFVLLVTSSILIIYFMRQLRSRLAQANSNINVKRTKKDLDYARTILFLDLIFLFLNFPYSFLCIIGNYFDYDPTAATVLYFIYYTSCSINFFVYIGSNKMFRKEIVVFLNFISNNCTQLSSVSDEFRQKVDG